MMQNGIFQKKSPLILPATISAGSLEAMEPSSKQWESIEAYCQHHGGDHVIKRILIANNGIAAVKCIRSLRRWAYAELGLDDALTFICMATPEDIQAFSPYTSPRMPPHLAPCHRLYMYVVEIA